MTLLFLDAEILAGAQKISLSRQERTQKLPLVSAWDLKVRMFISLISYVLYFLSTRHHKLEKKEGWQKKRKVNAGLFCANSHWILRAFHCITVVHCEYPNYCEILLS